MKVFRRKVYRRETPAVFDPRPDSANLFLGLLGTWKRCLGRDEND